MRYSILSIIGDHYNCYAIASRKFLSRTLAVGFTGGHLPREISRLACFMFLHSAIIVLKTVKTHNHTSSFCAGVPRNSYPSAGEDGLQTSEQMPYSSKSPTLNNTTKSQ